MKTRSQHFLGDLLLLIVAIIWGLGFVAVKIGLNDGISTFFLLALRFLIASLALLPFLVKKLKRVSPSTIKHGIILGTLMFLGFLFQTLGLNYTTTSKNAFITAVYVVLVPFVFWILTKTKVQRKSIVAAYMALIGIGLLTLNDRLSVNIGDILTFICAFMFAGHIALTSKIAKDEPTDLLVFIQMLTAGILSVLFTVLLKEEKHLALNGFIAVLYLGIFSTMLAFFLQTIGQKYAHASKSAILLSTESLFGAFFAIIFFNDPFTIRTGLGALIIFVSVILTESKGRKEVLSP